MKVLDSFRPTRCYKQRSKRVKKLNQDTTTFQFVASIKLLHAITSVLIEFLLQEVMLDYIFLKLGVNADTVQHPILMTEALCNPVYTRGRTYFDIHIIFE